MQLSLALEVVPSVGEFHAVILQKPIDTDSRKSQEAAQFGFSPKALPQSFEAEGLAGDAHRLRPQLGGQFIRDFQGDGQANR